MTQILYMNRWYVYYILAIAVTQSNSADEKILIHLKDYDKKSLEAPEQKVNDVIFFSYTYLDFFKEKN